MLSQPKSLLRVPSVFSKAENNTIGYRCLAVSTFQNEVLNQHMYEFGLKMLWRVVCFGENSSNSMVISSSATLEWLGELTSTSRKKTFRKTTWKVFLLSLESIWNRDWKV